MVAFCALLYYKKLLSKQDALNANDIAQLIRNRINQIKLKNKADPNNNHNNHLQLNNINLTAGGSPKKKYNQRIVNRWQVIVTLMFNTSLVSFRKHSSSHQKLII
jgi:hypothetical protein